MDSLTLSLPNTIFPQLESPACVLIDGLCGSACAMAAYLFNRRYNAATFSIGGTHGEDLSMFSFPGASIVMLREIQRLYKEFNMTCPIAELLSRSTVIFLRLEMCSEGRTMTLEHDAELYMLTYRLDCTPANACSVWKEAAAALWK